MITELIEKVEQEVKNYSVPVVDLIAIQTKDPFKVLVATILSARTKDETTAKAASRLFKRVQKQADLDCLTEKEISKLIYPVGFYKNKAKYLKKLPSALEKFNGHVPDTIDALITLPGVGRKTANLVVSVAFEKPAICVDTHVHRIMNIWGYVKTKTPLETEMALREKLPKKYWRSINSILVAFGQGTCKSVAPHCDRCIVSDLCPQIGVKPRKVKKTALQAGTMTFVSWNVNGIRAAQKKGFIDLVDDLSPDILALQETKAQPEQLSDDLLNIKGYMSFWHSAVRKGYSGVAMYCKKKPLQVLYGIGSEQYDQEGRVITLEFDDFFLVNAYFPNAQHGLKRMEYKLGFNQALQAFVCDLAKNKSTVLCGDYNVAHKSIDLKNPKSNEKNPGYSPEERAWMDTFLNEGFVDTFRKFNNEPENYTWWSYRFNARPRNIGWRIDYFCVNKESEHRVQDAEILKDIMGSDHCPVSVTFV